MRRLFPAMVTPESEGGYTLQFRDLPEAFTEAQTLDNLLDMAADVLEARLELNLPLPTPSAPQDGDVLIAARVSVSAVAA
jgi:antitoxin HicB